MNRLLPLFSVMVLYISGCTAATQKLPEATETTSWILETAYALPQRPSYIDNVFPRENSKIPLKSYIHEIPEIPMGSINTGFASNICVDFEPGSLMQPGDFLIDEILILERIVLKVDDITRSGRPKLASLTVEVLTGEEGIIVAEWPTFVMFCWDAPVEIGIHEVEFLFTQVDGNIASYSWQFEIVEEAWKPMPTSSVTPAEEGVIPDKTRNQRATK